MTLIINTEEFKDFGFSFLDMVRSYKKFEEEAISENKNITVDQILNAVAEDKCTHYWTFEGM